jgi:trimethylamine:corrinoid methyltransferase-like protein
LGKMKMRFLTRSDLERIHKASLKVLEKMGAQFRNSMALDYLEKYGCIVDRKTQIAKMPEGVVKEFMKKAKYRVLIESLRGSRKEKHIFKPLMKEHI